MPLSQWGPWSPDITDFESPGVKNISNVYPRGDGYGPFPSFTAYTQTLPGPCRGGFYALKSDGTVITFAGTATKLYQLNNATFAWTDVSLSGGNYSSLSSTAQWQFAQTGNFVFATQANVLLQVFDLSSATTFVNSLGSPPQAAYIAVVGSFLVLSGLLSAAYRICWSGLNDFNSSTSWTFGLNSSDFQDFPDGGLVRGVAGGSQSGIIFQDLMIRSMAYVAGSPIIFQIDKITQDMGLFAPYSIIRAGGNIFFYAGQGFQMIPPGGIPTQIGREKVDRTFIADLDKGNLQLFMGAADPRSTRIYWAYKSVAGASGSYDTLLGYDYVLNQFFPVSPGNGQYLLGISQTGLTLESLDAIAPTPLTITGAANNGSGKVRLTLSAESNANFSILTQNTISIYGIVGTTEANGTWLTSQFTVIDTTHIDLTSVSFVHTYVSGGQIGGSVDAMTLSFDDYATAVQPQLGHFNSSNVLGFFSGPSLEGIIQGSEQGTDGKRIVSRGFRPITDATSLFGSVSYRDTQGATPIVGPEVGMSRVGRIDFMRDSRYQRIQVRHPAGSVWSFDSGYELDVSTGGTQ